MEPLPTSDPSDLDLLPKTVNDEDPVSNRMPSQPEYGDEVLAGRVARQDVVAFTLLYDRYARSVYVMAVHLLGDGDAEEVVQEVFLRLWRKAHQFDETRGSFQGWFLTIARNHMVDELKRRSEEAQLRVAGEVEEMLTNTPDPDADVVQAVWHREQQQALVQGLKRLPPEQRRAILLAYFGGFSQSSIAEQLGWPLGTVKKRIRLGLQKLRTVFHHRDEMR